MDRRKFLKRAAYLGAGALVTAGLGLPFVQARPNRFRRHPPPTTTTSSQSSSETTSSTSSSFVNTQKTSTGMMVLLESAGPNFPQGAAQWQQIEAALAQPGVSQVPVLIVILPGVVANSGEGPQEFAQVLGTQMLSLQQQYPQVSDMAYIDTSGGDITPWWDGAPYVPLSAAESVTQQTYQLYNTPSSWNPSGVKLLEGCFYDDADWAPANQDGATPQEYYSTLQQYASSLGLSVNMGNCGGTPTAVGTLPFWNVWETPDYPTPSDLQQLSAGVPATNISWVCNGASSFDASIVTELAPYCGWCWVVPGDLENLYADAPYASQLLATLASIG